MNNADRALTNITDDLKPYRLTGRSVRSGNRMRVVGYVHIGCDCKRGYSEMSRHSSWDEAVAAGMNWTTEVKLCRRAVTQDV